MSYVYKEIDIIINYDINFSSWIHVIPNLGVYVCKLFGFCFYACYYYYSLPQ